MMGERSRKRKAEVDDETLGNQSPIQAAWAFSEV